MADWEWDVISDFCAFGAGREADLLGCTCGRLRCGRHLFTRPHLFNEWRLGKPALEAGKALAMPPVGQKSQKTTLTHHEHEPQNLKFKASMPTGPLAIESTHSLQTTRCGVIACGILWKGKHVV